ncbi:hypothetical protein GCM10027162_27470 [Streptomyces incanus]
MRRSEGGPGSESEPGPEAERGSGGGGVVAISSEPTDRHPALPTEFWPDPAGPQDLRPPPDPVDVPARDLRRTPLSPEVVPLHQPIG